MIFRDHEKKLTKAIYVQPSFNYHLPTMQNFGRDLKTNFESTRGTARAESSDCSSEFHTRLYHTTGNHTFLYLHKI